MPDIHDSHTKHIKKKIQIALYLKAYNILVKANIMNKIPLIQLKSKSAL